MAKVLGYFFGPVFATVCVFAVQSSVAWLQYVSAWKSDRITSGARISNFVMMNNFMFGELSDEYRTYKMRYFRAMRRAGYVLALYAAAIIIYAETSPPH